MLLFLFQMASLSTALARNANYRTPVKCKVIAVSNDLTYNNNGQTVTYRTAGLAHGNTAIKATVYSGHFQRFTAGTCLLISNYAMSNGNMTVRSNARIYGTSNNVQVDNEATTRAQHIVTPPSTPAAISELGGATPGALYTLTVTVENVSTFN